MKEDGSRESGSGLFGWLWARWFQSSTIGTLQATLSLIFLLPNPLFTVYSFFGSLLHHYAPIILASDALCFSLSLQLLTPVFLGSLWSFSIGFLHTPFSCPPKSGLLYFYSLPEWAHQFWFQIQMTCGQFSNIYIFNKNSLTFELKLT